MNEDPLTRAADCVARGADLPEDSELDARQSRNLKRLAAIASLFAQGPEKRVQHWGHLEVLEALGEGGFGIVYRAHDPVLKRDVALKLRREADDDDSTRLITEARRLARVRHPNVLAVHGADIHEGQIGIWSDLIGGQTLAQRIESGWRASEDSLVKLMGELLNALLAVHERGLVHGDVKPSNLMFDDDGRLVLMDFGASQQADTSGSPRYGSPRYMAPELFDRAPASAASDVFACAVVAVYAATGRYPSECGDKEVDTALSARQLRRRLGRDWFRLLTSMLDAAPGRRPSAPDIAHAIRRIATAPRRRRKRWTLAVVLASLTVGLTLALVGRQQAQRALVAAEKSADHVAAVNSVLENLLNSPRPTALGIQVTVAEALDDFSPRLATALVDQPLARADLLTVVGRTRQSLGDLETSEDNLREALQLARSHAPNSVQEFEITRHLAETLAKADAFEEAYALTSSALASIDRLYPDNSELKAVIRSTAGFVASLTNRFDEASKWLEEARVLGESVEWTYPGNEAALYLRMADLAARQGDYPESEAASRNALAISLEAHGEKHVNTIQSRGALARTLMETGQFRKALPLVQENYDLVVSWLGRDTEYTWEQAILLAVGYHSAGRHEEAVEVLVEVIASIEHSQSPRSSSALVAKNNLANNLKYLGRYEEAIDLYRFVHSASVESFGEDHIQALVASNNLAEAYLDGGQADQAILQAQASLTKNTAVLGAAHPFTAHAAMILGAAESRQAPSPESIDRIEQAALRFAATVGDASELYFQARSYQARALVDAGRHVDAQSIVAADLDRMTQTLGPEHSVTRRLAEVGNTLESRETDR